MLSLLTKRTFLPLFLTQFFGAFNDNAFKLAMLTSISYFLSTSQIQSEQYQAIASGLFISPFFLFSATAGQLADTFDKARMTVIIKIFEVFLIILGGLGLFFGNVLILMITLAGIGIHSSFFGPIKYAILPEHLPKSELLGATALVEGSTFLAILLGTTLGTLAIGGIGMKAIYAIILTFLAAVFGLIASCFIPSAPAPSKQFPIDWQIGRATIQMLKDVMRNKRVVPALFTISWFWFIGVVVLTKLPDYTNYVLRGHTSVFAFFLAVFAIGIATGSLSINQLLKGKLTVKYVPLAIFINSIFLCDLLWATPSLDIKMPLQSLPSFLSSWSNIRISIDLFFMAFCGGAYIVPLYTHLQIASEGKFRARTIASNNIINALFMVVGTLFVMITVATHLPIAKVFFILGSLNVIASIIFWKLLKD